MWQVHHQKVDLLFDTANHGECLAKIRLSMARRMRQWHEHLPLTLLGREDIGVEYGRVSNHTLSLETVS